MIRKAYREITEASIRFDAFKAAVILKLRALAVEVRSSCTG